MGLSLPHLIVLALVVLILFGRGRISEMMGDFGKGIKSFREGMNESDKQAPPAQIEAPQQNARPSGEAAPDANGVANSAPRSGESGN